MPPLKSPRLVKCEWPIEMGGCGDYFETRSGKAKICKRCARKKKIKYNHEKYSMWYQAKKSCLGVPSCSIVKMKKPASWVKEDDIDDVMDWCGRSMVWPEFLRTAQLGFMDGLVAEVNGKQIMVRDSIVIMEKI